jgi:plastocyanin
MLMSVVLATAALAKGASVSVGDNFFKPKSLTVKSGATVKWHWVGKSPHNVTLTHGPKGVKQFMSKTQNKGSYSHKFTVKGSYSIVCTIHANMTMHLTVK